MYRFVDDVACGLTLGCVLVAQSLAHASLCGVEVISGPYSCIVQRQAAIRV